MSVHEAMRIARTIRKRVMFEMVGDPFIANAVARKGPTTIANTNTLRTYTPGR